VARQARGHRLSGGKISGPGKPHFGAAPGESDCATPARELSSRPGEIVGLYAHSLGSARQNVQRSVPGLRSTSSIALRMQF